MPRIISLGENTITSASFLPQRRALPLLDGLFWVNVNTSNNTSNVTIRLHDQPKKLIQQQKADNRNRGK